MKTIVNFVSYRPWGFEAQCTVTCDDGTVYNEIIVSKEALPGPEYIALAEQKVTDSIVQAALNEIIPTESVEIINQDGTTETMEVPL